jgi:hypothetical protein
MSEEDGGLSLSDTIDELRKLMAPVFEAQKEQWEQNGPIVMARADGLGITIDNIGGNCPVQATGSFDDQEFYFRARGDSWQLHVGPHNDRFSGKEWVVTDDYGEWPEAGWMPRHEAVMFICDCVEKYRKEKA